MSCICNYSLCPVACLPLYNALSFSIHFAQHLLAPSLNSAASSLCAPRHASRLPLPFGDGLRRPVELLICASADGASLQLVIGFLSMK